MIDKVKMKRLPPIPEPIEFEGKPIIARLLIDADDIQKVTTTKVSLSLKKSFFDQYEKGSFIDLIYLEEPEQKIYRYKMVSENDTAINFRLGKIL